MNALLPAPAEVKEAAAARDRERLQGVWNFITGRRKARLVIDAGRFTMTFSSGEVYRGTFGLNPTARPKAMDMVVEEGPEKHRGKTALCIYALDGPHLVWAPGDPGAGKRPTAFPPSESREPLCLVFRKEKVLQAAQR
jgi:uncharacterized protein (TIGR03067 family)